MSDTRILADSQLGPEYFKITEDSYEGAMRYARRLQSDDAKLRKLCGSGNYADIKLRLTFDGPGRISRRYGVFVKRLETSSC